MVWEDFVELFDMVDICRIRDNASYFCYPATFNYKNGSFFQFELYEQADITLAISQKSLRGVSKLKMKRGYSKTTIILAKCIQVCGSTEYKFLKSNECISFPDHYLDAQRLKEGRYVFFVKADWIDKGTERGVVSVYTEAKINLKSAP